MTQLLGSNNPMFQGLAITVIGMGLVFTALALIWVLIKVLARVFPPKPSTAGVHVHPVQGSARVDASGRVAGKLTAERAQVAAIVAAALAAGVLPLPAEALVRPALGPRASEMGVAAPDLGIFEHGRTAPSWVTANRARALQPWQPTRRPES